jgi:DNA-directed RNA polymerase specialized sigma24 family protein
MRIRIEITPEIVRRVKSVARREAARSGYADAEEAESVALYEICLAVKRYRKPVRNSEAFLVSVASRRVLNWVRSQKRYVARLDRLRNA